MSSVRNRILLAVATVLVVGLAAACSSDTDIPIVNDPKPKVVGTEARDGLVGADYTVWVECTVENEGDTGDVEVTAELNGGGAWVKDRKVAVGENTQETVEIEFPEPEALNEGINGFSFSCSAEPA